MDPELITKALDAIEAGDSASAIAILKQLIASAASDGDSVPPTPGDPVTESSDTPPTDPSVPEKPKANPAAYSKEIATLTTLNESLATRLAALESERAAEDLEVRRELITELVKMGYELPATAWTGDPAKRTPCKRLTAEPIAEMRARVAALKAARPVALSNLEPPITGAPDITTLSKAELKACKERGLDPAEYVVAKQNAVRRIT